MEKPPWIFRADFLQNRLGSSEAGGSGAYRTNACDVRDTASASQVKTEAQIHLPQQQKFACYICCIIASGAWNVTLGACPETICGTPRAELGEQV